MAASLRTGLGWIIKGCQTWLPTAASVTPPVLRHPGKAVSTSFSILPRISAHSYGCLSPAWRTLNTSLRNTTAIGASNRCIPVQPATVQVEQVRTKIRYSLGKGRPKTVHSVPERFYRLHWGAWIRTRAGRAKRLWQKTSERKYRLRQHVFCNRQQSKLLDKMVSDCWKRPKHWVEDPYEPYQTRKSFELHFPEKKRPFYP